MRSIGQLARESGLSVSALRFYDGAGVFGPARVDPHTGYRWYSAGQLDDARLLCRLRRVGLPLAEIRQVLGAPPSSGEARRVLDRHLRRLEDGLSDARRELSTVRALLDQRENPMNTPITATRLTVRAAELAGALDAVRFAASTDPGLPLLGGVFFDLDGPVLRVVATDRFRLAVSQATVTDRRGPDASATVPAPVVDGMRALLTDSEEGTVTLTVEGDRVALEIAGRRIEGAGLEGVFPDYRRLTRLETDHRVEVSPAALRDAVLSGGTRKRPEGDEITVLTVRPDGALAVAADSDEGSDRGSLRVALNPAYLLEAIGAGSPEQLVLELGGPIAPLAIRDADAPGTFSLLMPVRLS
ncbi:DNA polymerase III subunit beta family protein [Streptomyces meridianus]|uniref:MerR family transcriptional regulator n=1 Tax=Streptomyces meridianus TaxID=2938945 RepID=A0ABT0XA87_9ACTN|nr:MerR family transcriptional regulator [Streptomyces meridianus]MCM2579210.1 MerR family transcriptional regulator [Streptomyces meridianus]